VDSGRRRPRRPVSLARAALAIIALAELREHWYAVRILAPARYRAALWAAVGQRAGDHHFYDVATVQRATASVVWPDQ
jgi:hypothetical protein